MMSPEQRLGAFATEGDFREKLLHAVLRWQQRLAGGDRSPSALAVIASEMADLRAMAQLHNWATSQHLLYLENVAKTAPSGLSQALSTVVNVLRVANVPVSDRTTPLAPGHQRPAPGAPGPSRPSPSGRPVALASPVPGRASDSIAPPPLIGGPEPNAPSPLAASTNVLPDSHMRPRPPNLLKSILGLPAIWKKSDAKGRSPGASRPAKGPIESPGKGLFDFSALSSEAAQPLPTPIPPGPRFGWRRQRPWSGRGSDRPSSSKPGKPAKPGVGGRGPQSQGPDSTLEPAVPRWFYVLIALVGLLGIATIGTIIALGRRPKGPLPPTTASTQGAELTAQTAQPSVASAAVVASPPKQWQKQGTQTSDLLRDLLDLQAKLASSCRDNPATCGGRWTPLAKEALVPLEIRDFKPSAAAPPPAWLKQLALPPDMPVRDELALRNSFNFHVHHTVGRPAMQALLFDCSRYSEIFKRAFIQYGAPPWLAAVSFQESGCNPRATSPVGAKGLWQFMPESARIYGLRVREGDVDERLNPVKSTDAAVRFLPDLERMLGTWDLTLAAYNMGPFAVVKRLEQLGGGVGFWDLVHAHVLPEETAGYVPAIEAYALVLANISFLKFSPDGIRPEGAEEVNVKAGMRLSLIARAASTSTARIRELNPEFLRDVVPDEETTARVPDAQAYSAQAFLDAWARNPGDDRDTCVPENFDWGAKQFERSEYAKSCAAGR